MRDKSKGAECDEERRAYGYMTAETMLERGEREREDKGEVCDGWSNTTNCDNDDDEVEREEGTVYRLNDTSNVKQKPKDDYAGDRP